MSPPPRDFTDVQMLFVSALPVIEGIIARLARNSAFSDAEIEEFESWAKERLMENSYARLRKFAGRSTFATFLSTVLANLFHDFRNHHWGRWRPSAAALRLGPLAVKLDELINRDRIPQREAEEIVRSRGITMSNQEFSRLLLRIERRAAVEEVPLAAVEGECDMSPRAAADAFVEHEELGTIKAALQDAIAELPAEDAVIIKLQYWNTMSTADIARTLHLDQKALYRRQQALLERLKLFLRSRGIDFARARDVLGVETHG